MGQATLTRALDGALAALWPRRAQQELILDLGERKRWGAAERTETVARVAEWLQRELLLPGHVGEPADLLSDADVMGQVRAHVHGDTTPRSPEAGVARWLQQLSPAVGSSPKALANSLSGGLRSARVDHRWLRAIGRVRASRGAPSAWAFHARTARDVAVQCARWAAPDRLDAGDALLLFSLLALWQRRRPTVESRGNRKAQRPRRDTPKPIAAVTGSLIAPGQLAPLLAIAAGLDREPGRALAVLVAEAALTEAHLAPHPRRRDRVDNSSGEAWLRRIDDLIASGEPVMGEVDAAVLRFRVATMRAYARREAFPVPDETLTGRSSYVRMSAAIQRANVPTTDTRTCDAHEPGLLMLLPQLRARGFLVTP